ncbi:MAG: FAD-dependent oxidoreductase [Thermodesulfobacteriota bacterium]
MSVRKLLIIGGVAGGASCAARARRTREDLSIVILEKGPFVSFANCGLPYYVGNLIKKEEDLLVASPELFRKRFAVDVRVLSEAVAIDRDKKIVRVRDLAAGREYDEPYDALVLSPGARPFAPPVPGTGLPGVFSVRNIPDCRDILDWAGKNRVGEAVVVGGGYIGVEIAENLARRGIRVAIVEREKHLLPPLDPEMAVPVHAAAKKAGVELHLSQSLAGIAAEPGGKLSVSLSLGRVLSAGMVILATGVVPETGLARAAGLALGESGGIAVDSRLRTSDPHIWAVGDAVEKTSLVTGLSRLVPLAGPANRQGRMAADIICAGEGKGPEYRGTLGTSVVGAFGMTAAATGETEKSLAAAAKKGVSIPYERVYAQALDHAEYYPGAKTLIIKLLVRKEDGRILGAQAVGEQGVEKRVDVIAAMIFKHATAADLENLDLCYAPQFGSAKDPANLAAMIAGNALSGFAPVARWEEAEAYGAVILDVRTPFEWKRGHVPGALHIPVDELRQNLDSLPEDKEIWTYCYVGARSHLAVRMISQTGRKARNLTGGYAIYQMMKSVED